MACRARIVDTPANRANPSRPERRIPSRRAAKRFVRRHALEPQSTSPGLGMCAHRQRIALRPRGKIEAIATRRRRRLSGRLKTEYLRLSLRMHPESGSNAANIPIGAENASALAAYANRRGQKSHMSEPLARLQPKKNRDLNIRLRQSGG